MQRDLENEQKIKDDRVFFGPAGLTKDQEKALKIAKKADMRKALEAQIQQNAFSKQETKETEYNNGRLANMGVQESLQEERRLNELRQRSQQELLRTAWDDQIARTRVIKQIDDGK